MPSNVRLITGNAGKRKLNEDEPQVPLVIPDPPKRMTEAAREWWDYYAKILVGMRVLSEGDAIMLALLCEATLTYFDCLEIARDKGPVINLSTDKKKPYFGSNPFHTEVKQAEKRMRDYLAEFGLSPSSRSRSKVL
jgi:P27 family predicted phage terminase small subunit